MAVAPRGHRHRWRAIRTFISRPTAVTANEGTRRQDNCFERKPNGSRATRAVDIAGELFYLTASRIAVAPRGHRHRGRANNHFFISQQAE